MPLSYHIAPHLHLLYIRGEGVITQLERLFTLRAWLRDPDYPDCDTALCDFTATESTPTMAELHELVTIMSQHEKGRGPKRLAIATAKPITFGVAREFKEIAGIAGVPIEVKVFDAVDAAWAWLKPGQRGSEDAAKAR